MQDHIQNYISLGLTVLERSGSCIDLRTISFAYILTLNQATGLTHSMHYATTS